MLSDVSTALFLAVLAVSAAAQEDPRASYSTADHKKFDVLEGPFSSGPEVTRACLSCHTEAGEQVLGSIHWTWQYEHPLTGELLGKRHVINSFCGNLVHNEPRCTSCHAGYGWDDAGFDFSDQSRIDCLVCHDKTGEYVKWATGAGHPLYEPTVAAKRFGNYPETLVSSTDDGRFLYQPPDLAEIARNVGPPDRDDCGSCHFYGGGGDNVKHGDLSSALNTPPVHVDVHMSEAGAGLVCTDCHSTHGHRIPGSRYLGTVKGETSPVPGFRRAGVASCASCHTRTPHDSTTLTGIKLDHHVDRVACQTCHIPELARGGVATKTWWDWSTAGKLRDGKPYAEYNDAGQQIYASQKGSSQWSSDVVPEYSFWDGVVEYTLLGEHIDPSGVVGINRIGGGPEDEDSVIYPFKLMKGRQAYDTENRYLLLADLYGPGSDSAFWANFDWSRALAAGMRDSGVAFSGKYDFVETKMWWPTSHMVAPAEHALKCGDCHAQQARLAALGGFYLPGRDQFAQTNRIGLWLLTLALAAVLLHATLRMIAHRFRWGNDAK